MVSLTSTNRIAHTFEALRQKGEKALIPYIMAGDPSLTETEALVLAMEEAGANIIELGVPFSDPIAHGPVIQRAAERALRTCTSLRGQRRRGLVLSPSRGNYLPTEALGYRFRETEQEAVLSAINGETEHADRISDLG